VKSDGSYERFDENKLRDGFSISLQKRPINAEQVENALQRLLRQFSFSGHDEINSVDIGEAVMAELRDLDEVAYVRFASVYRKFQDLDEFNELVQRLREVLPEDSAGESKTNLSLISGAEKKRTLAAFQMKPDQFYMARALKLAERGRYSTQPNPRVGCVIVKADRIVGEGFHQFAGCKHAEIIALAQAGSMAHDATVFVSLEPCSHQGKTPPCADALIDAGVACVVVAMQDPNPLVSGQGIERLEMRGISVRSGVCEAEARVLNRGFIKRMQSGFPFVTLKLAASLDGRVAMQSGESAWITSSAARTDVHRLRLESCAIVTGINTVLADDPRLTVRLHAGDIAQEYFCDARQPVRVVLDSRQLMPENAAITQQPGETWQVVSEDIEPGSQGMRVIPVRTVDGRLDLAAVLAYLGTQQMNNVLVEAGGTLAAGFVKAGLVDELVVYQSPDIMGSSAQAMFNLPEMLKMSEKIRFEYQDLRKIGRDLKLTLVNSSRIT